jgi:hypothetical protein
MLGDVAVVEFREPADKQRHVIGASMLMRDVSVYAARSKSRGQTGRLHRDPSVGGVIDECQPTPAFYLRRS